jgi:hypothetical protein
MIHITRREALVGLMGHASQVLPKGSYLFLYGPFWQEGEPRVPSNIAFDEHLKTIDPDFGIWHLDDVRQAANERGLSFDRSLKMPANNLSLFFQKI